MGRSFNVPRDRIRRGNVNIEGARAHASQTVSTVIVRNHVLPRRAEINHRIPECDVRTKE
jgi:hypothetical protein